MAELMPTIPTPLANAAEWKITASHNGAAAANPTSGAGGRWDSAAPQAPGMWFQIELPQPAQVTEVILESALPFNFGGGRGGRGAGAGPAAGRGAAPAGPVPGGPPAAASPTVPPQ